VRLVRLAVEAKVNDPVEPGNNTVEPDPDMVLSCSHANELDTSNVAAPVNVPPLPIVRPWMRDDSRAFDTSSIPPERATVPSP
jgi:hypothetical protein